MADESIVHEHLLAWSMHRTLGACLCYRFCGWKPPCFLVVGFGNGKTCAVPGVGLVGFRVCRITSVGFRVYRIEETKADWAICRLPSTTMIHVSGTFSDRLLLFFSQLSHAENLPPRKLKLRSRKLCVSFGVSQTFPGYVISMLRKQSLQWRKVA